METPNSPFTDKLMAENCKLQDSLQVRSATARVCFRNMLRYKEAGNQLAKAATALVNATPCPSLAQYDAAEKALAAWSKVKVIKRKKK